MKLETFTYRRDRWSVDPLPALDSPSTLVMVFGAPEFRRRTEPIRELLDAYPSSHVVGCSTSGEIFGNELQDASLVVSVVRLEHGHLRRAWVRVGDGTDSYQAGSELARELVDPGLRGVVVLSDGLRVNGSELIRGINAVLPDGAVVTGGLAGDADRFGDTWVMSQGLPRSGSITAVGLYGDRLRIGHGSRGGWDIFGPERRITRSDGNVLHALDGKPALDLYKQYLGDRADGLPATALLFPLSLRPDADSDRRVVRTILAVDEASRSMTFAGDVPEGSLAQLMRANFDRLIEGAYEAGRLSRADADVDGPTLSIAISCVGRRLVLGERAEEEIEAALECLPTGTRQVGFYSYGELSPLADGRCDLHNQTMTLTTLRES